MEINKCKVFGKLLRQDVQQFSRYRAVTAKMSRKFAFRLSRATINYLNIIAVLKGDTILKVNVCKYHPDPPARSNSDGLGRIVIVGIEVWVVWRRQDTTLWQPRISLHHICNVQKYESWQRGKSKYYWLVLLTPFQPPAPPACFPIAVKPNMNSVSDARQVESFDRPLRLLLMPRTAVCVRPLMVFVPIVESAWSKTCQVSTIPLCDSNVVISISLLIQLEVCEADVDPVALSCLDRLDQVHVVGIVAREEGRRHLSACCHDLRLFRQNAWKKRGRRKRVFILATYL